jgi:hypothetical protein
VAQDGVTSGSAVMNTVINVGFEALSSVTMSSYILWDVTFVQSGENQQTSPPSSGCDSKPTMKWALLNE